MHIYKNGWFEKYARKEKIGDRALRDAIERAEAGLVDADLGGGLIKQRVARAGKPVNIKKGQFLAPWDMKHVVKKALATGNPLLLEQAAAARDAVLEVLLDKVEVPLPETMVTDELNARRQNIEQQLGYAGISMEKYLEDEGQTVEEFEADLDRRVREAVAAQFLLDEVAKKESLGVDQQELSGHLVRRAQQSGQDPQEFANHMFEHNHIPEMVQEILRGKALATIVESAIVTDASGNVVELKNLRPDGTIGEPEAEVAAPDEVEDAAEADQQD